MVCISSFPFRPREEPRLSRGATRCLPGPGVGLTSMPRVDEWTGPDPNLVFAPVTLRESSACRPESRSYLVVDGLRNRLYTTPRIFSSFLPYRSEGRICPVRRGA